MRLPTLEKSGQWASSSVPNCASASVQAVLPSAAPGLIEKPGGRVTVVALSSVGEGIVALTCWGTARLTSIPEGASVRRGGRLRVETGVEAELVAAGHLRPGVLRMGYTAVIGEDFKR